MCAGELAGDVNALSGCVAVGVDESRSVYDTNESRLFACACRAVPVLYALSPAPSVDVGVTGSNWRAVGGAVVGEAEMGGEGNVGMGVATCWCCCCCASGPGEGILSRRELRLPLRGLGLGLRERKLPMGDANPLLRLRTVV
jgi:hypothetical protein